MYNWGYTISRNWGYTIDIIYSEDIPLVAILGVCFSLNVISIIGLTGKWLEHPTEKADIVVPGASAENIEAELRYLRCTPNNCWLVVSTPLNNISQLGLLFPIYGNIKNVPNHQRVMKKWSNHIRDYHPNAPWCWNIHQHLPSKSLKCSYIHHAWSIWVMALLLIKCVPTTSPNWESRNSMFVLVCVAWTTGLGCIGSGSKFGNPWQTAKSKPQVHDTHTHTHLKGQGIRAEQYLRGLP